MLHRLPLLVVAALLAGQARAGDDLAAKVNDFINAPRYKQAHWGILVVDARTGKAVYEHNAERLFAPASTTKLFSCATALGVLGPDYRFETPVYRRGEVKDGTLKGDLILVASGDLTFGGRTDKNGHIAFTDGDHTYANGNTTAKLTDTDPLAALKELARQIKSAGITRVTGDILIDDRLFAPARGSGSGPDLLTPILVNDNVVDLVITPGEKPGDPAAMEMRPQTSFVQIDARIKTAEKGKGTLTVLKVVGPRRLVVRGHIPVGAKPLVRIYAVDDPAAYARALFIETLRREGVEVEASPLGAADADLPEKDGYKQLQRVAAYTSPPLAEAIKVTLKVSHNLYASTLPLLVAAKEGKRTLREGMRLQRKFLKGLGVDVATISFGGGAGGASADMVSPRAAVQLLLAMRKRPEYAAYKEALPVLGVDGTLADVVGPDSLARGKVCAKTGTLGWTDLMNDRLLLRSKALAGVMTTAGGRELAFALFVNDVPLPKGTPASRVGKALGKLCEIIHGHCP